MNQQYECPECGWVGIESEMKAGYTGLSGWSNCVCPGCGSHNVKSLDNYGIANPSQTVSEPSKNPILSESADLNVERYSEKQTECPKCGWTGQRNGQANFSCPKCRQWHIIDGYEDRTIGSIVHHDGGLEVRKKGDEYQWRLETWETIPKYLYDALIRFDDGEIE